MYYAVYFPQEKSIEVTEEQNITMPANCIVGNDVQVKWPTKLIEEDGTESISDVHYNGILLFQSEVKKQCAKIANALKETLNKGGDNLEALIKEGRRHQQESKNSGKRGASRLKKIVDSITEGETPKKTGRKWWRDQNRGKGETGIQKQKKSSVTAAEDTNKGHTSKRKENTTKENAKKPKLQVNEKTVHNMSMLAGFSTIFPNENCEKAVGKNNKAAGHAEGEDKLTSTGAKAIAVCKKNQTAEHNKDGIAASKVIDINDQTDVHAEEKLSKVVNKNKNSSAGHAKDKDVEITSCANVLDKSSRAAVYAEGTFASNFLTSTDAVLNYTELNNQRETIRRLEEENLQLKRENERLSLQLEIYSKEKDIDIDGVLWHLHEVENLLKPDNMTLKSCILPPLSPDLPLETNISRIHVPHHFSSPASFSTPTISSRPAHLTNDTPSANGFHQPRTLFQNQNIFRQPLPSTGDNSEWPVPEFTVSSQQTQPSHVPPVSESPSALQKSVLSPQQIQSSHVPPITEPTSASQQSTSALHQSKTVSTNIPQCRQPMPSSASLSTSTSSSSKRMPQESTVKQVLVVDPKDKERFSSVLVDSSLLYRAEQKASSSADPAGVLLNSVTELVFSQKDLAESSGLGIRPHKQNEAEVKMPLNPLKFDAIREYIKAMCIQRNWTTLPPQIFNRKFTYKITNARRDIAKPQLETKLK